MEKKYKVIKRIIRSIMALFIIMAIFADKTSISEARNRIDLSKKVH